MTRTDTSKQTNKRKERVTDSLPCPLRSIALRRRLSITTDQQQQQQQQKKRRPFVPLFSCSTAPRSLLGGIAQPCLRHDSRSSVLFSLCFVFLFLHASSYFDASCLSGGAHAAEGECRPLRRREARTQTKTTQQQQNIQACTFPRDEEEQAKSIQKGGMLLFPPVSSSCDNSRHTCMCDTTTQAPNFGSGGGKGRKKRPPSAQATALRDAQKRRTKKTSRSCRE